MTQAEEFLKMLPAQTKDFRNTNLYAEYRRAKCDAKRFLLRHCIPFEITQKKLTVNNWQYDLIESQGGQGNE